MRGGASARSGTSGSHPSVTVEPAGSAPRVPAVGLPPFDLGSGANSRACIQSVAELCRLGPPAAAHHSLDIFPAAEFAEHLELQVHWVGSELAPQRVPGPSALALRSRALLGVSPTPGCRFLHFLRHGHRTSRPSKSMSNRRSWRMARMRCRVSCHRGQPEGQLQRSTLPIRLRILRGEPTRPQPSPVPLRSAGEGRHRLGPPPLGKGVAPSRVSFRFADGFSRASFRETAEPDLVRWLRTGRC